MITSEAKVDVNNKSIFDLINCGATFPVRGILDTHSGILGYSLFVDGTADLGRYYPSSGDDGRIRKNPPGGTLAGSAGTARRRSLGCF